jgi:hypothetical protein
MFEVFFILLGVFAIWLVGLFMLADMPLREGLIGGLGSPQEQWSKLQWLLFFSGGWGIIAFAAYALGKETYRSFVLCYKARWW